ncbi:NAD(P)-dependent oxidoreductase [Pseudomonas sp. YY-1]|uniref:NAD-dependent epimerase/dehydratase family protein n=1 Tax=Pseudomonas sp. YY-1 TaxID=2058659 RepID=UPI00211510AA|nr:NAD(P)-dependent oxidoreductase [Pseudomonas sp. YY-1]
MGAYSVSPESSLIRTDLRRIPAALGLAESLAGRHLLMTGGTGFFGKWLLALLYELNRQGAAIEVTLVSRDPTRFLALQPEYRSCTWLHWLVGDVRDLRRLPGRPVELILHAAADTSAAAHADPLTLFDCIVGGARRVLDLAIADGAQRVLLTGSGAQYGVLSGPGVTETSPGACASNSVDSTYGEAKRAQEVLGAIYAKHYGVDVIMTRCFAFSGAGLPLDAHFAIGNFVRDALWKEAVVLNSSGEALRSYLHGADLAGWLLTLLLRGESGQAYNVGSDQAISIAELARRVLGRVAPGKSLQILGQANGGGRSFYVPDISRARQLGLDIWTSLDASIDSMADWARNSGDSR